MGTHSDKLAVVTGAALGLGRDFAVGLAKEGATVVAITRKTPLDETKAEVEAVGGKILCLKGDCANPDDVARLARETYSFYPRVDILVNNAGIFPFCLFEDMDYKAFSEVRNTNMDSVFYMTKAFIGSMKANNWGRIVNIVSNSVATTFTAGLAHYVASKMGIMGLSRGIANEVGQHNITVNCLGPNLTPSPGVEALESHMPPGAFELLPQLGAIKRVAAGSDYVGMLNFLTSDAASYITGQTYYIDGGLTRYE
jgi:NAD(P)-dependent dehydrogenase (short-subunit alcohol dehydrogenase family)